MVTEEETYENQVLPENQDAVPTKEGTNNKPNVGLRRSKRPKKRVLHDDDYLQDSKHDVNDIEDPMNFRQAMMSDRNENWWAAMKSELRSMVKNGVWELVPLPLEEQTNWLQVGVQN